MSSHRILFRLALGWTMLLVLLVLAMSCGGVGGSKGSNSSDLICDCIPVEPASSDYRHNQKHVPLPTGTPQEIDVETVLSWPHGSDPGFDAPRTGRENQLFHIAQAYLQLAAIMPDCDLHIEISQLPDRTAPRMIVEVPVEQEYCSSRKTLQQQLANHGFNLTSTSGDLDQPLLVEVLGLAFRDFEHERGSKHVITPWELHPATVDLLQ